VAAADGRLILAAVEVHHSFRLRHHAARDAAAGLDSARARVRSATPVEEVTRVAASVARGLTEIAEEMHADLVVVGSSEPVTEGHVIPGRTGLRLLQGAPCAVAVAPAGATDEGPFRHVAIAYDGSPEAAAALAAGYAVAARDGAAVSLFWVSPAAGIAWDESVERAVRAERLHAHERLDAAAESAPPGVNPRTVVLRGDPGPMITGACDGIADVLFAGSRGYGPMHRALAGSVSEALLLTATQPVVITPRRARLEGEDGAAAE
jgi:nucleotide-binding universal stress UspA family protein